MISSCWLLPDRGKNIAIGALFFDTKLSVFHNFVLFSDLIKMLLTYPTYHCPLSSSNLLFCASDRRIASVVGRRAFRRSNHKLSRN